MPVYRDGPPTGRTGGFGEPLCTECHFGTPLDADPGRLTPALPASFEPGESYTLAIELEHPDMAAAGFQLAVRVADGDAAGAPAGTLEPAGPRTAVTTDTATDIPYGHHTVAGTALTGPARARWTLQWTAPDTVVDVVVHIAANAANDDASEFGDRIFAAEARIPAVRTGSRHGAGPRCGWPRAPALPGSSWADDSGSRCADGPRHHALTTPIATR